MAKKYLVFAENQFCMLKNEYFGLGDNCVIGYHDPRKCTHFSTKKEAKEFAVTFNRETKIEEVEKHLKAFDKFNGVYRTLPLIDRGINVKYDPKKDTPDKILQWWMRYQLLPEGSVSSEIYRSWPYPYSVFKHLWSFVKYHSKDYKEFYFSVQIRTSRDGVFKEFKKEIYKILDTITYTEGEYKILQIFDHELSEYECRFFLYKSDRDCKIKGDRRDLFKGTMEQCFEEMRKNYYY